jgi:hypothetical protein
MICAVGYEWLGQALERLEGIEPHEVVQVLRSTRRWPRTATSSTTSIQVLTIWGRTPAGRPLIVAVRPVGEWVWQIVGARMLRPVELTEFEQWEADDE